MIFPIKTLEVKTNQIKTKKVLNKWMIKWAEILTVTTQVPYNDAQASRAHRRTTALIPGVEWRRMNQFKQTHFHCMLKVLKIYRAMRYRCKPISCRRVLVLKKWSKIEWIYKKNRGLKSKSSKSKRVRCRTNSDRLTSLNPAYHRKCPKTKAIVRSRSRHRLRWTRRTFMTHCGIQTKISHKKKRKALAKPSWATTSLNAVISKWKRR